MSRNFGRNTARDKLIALEKKLAALGKDRENVDLAISLAGDSWHLCDWVFKETGNRIGFSQLRPFQDYVKAQCSNLAFMQDICTEDKHAEISRYQPSIDGAIKEQYVSGYCEDGYVEAPLMILTTANVHVPFLDAARNVVKFWQQFFICHKIA